MEIQGEKLLETDRAAVWKALNDPAVLRRCLPGCDTFEPDGEHRYRVAMQANVGPVRARFSGRLELRDVMPPTSYALSFEGSGGVAGFGKGTAQVTLSDAPQGTRLCYTAQAQVGGRLAQVGARLIDGVTRRMADDFFSRFVAELRLPDAATASNPGVPAQSVTGALAPINQAPAHRPAGVVTVPAPRDAFIAVVAAAVAATAAAVAVLAAVVAIHFAR